jgi:hypothetical protein
VSIEHEHPRVFSGLQDGRGIVVVLVLTLLPCIPPDLSLPLPRPSRTNPKKRQPSQKDELTKHHQANGRVLRLASTCTQPISAQHRPMWSFFFGAKEGRGQRARSGSDLGATPEWGLHLQGGFHWSNKQLHLHLEQRGLAH